MSAPFTAEEKLCKKCSTVKPFEQFYKNHRAADGHESACKPCKNASLYAWRKENPEACARIAAAYRKRNPEAVRESLAAWHEKHPEYERNRRIRRFADAQQKSVYDATQARRRSRVRAVASELGALTQDEVAYILSQPCAYCWAPATEVDHVVPIASGGTHTMDNVVPACRSCNARKSNRSLLTWLTVMRRDAERKAAHV